MTPCSPERLEAYVAQQLTAPEAAVVEAHLARCPRCQHERNWLATERQLFRQRSSHDEVDALWAKLEARGGVGRRPPSQLSRLALSLAATLLLLLGASQALLHAAPARGRGAGWVLGPGEVATLESREAAQAELCSRLPDGEGFRCLLPASFVASR